MLSDSDHVSQTEVLELHVTLTLKSQVVKSFDGLFAAGQLDRVKPRRGYSDIRCLREQRSYEDDSFTNDTVKHLRLISVIPTFVSHINYVPRVQSQVDEVIDVMQENISKVIERGERLDDLQDKSGESPQHVLL